MWFLGFVILSALFDNGSAIICYECNSAINSMCWEAATLPASLKRNCTEHDRGGVQNILCRKIIQYVDHGVNGRLPEPRLIRTCGWDDTKYKNTCYHRSGYGGRQEVCSCNKNLCNSTNRLPSSILLTIVSSVFMMLGIKLCERS